MKAILIFALPALAALILSGEEPSSDIPTIECTAPKMIINAGNKNINPAKVHMKYSNWEFQPAYTNERRKRNEGC
jgi:hypothetical protein